MGISGCQSSGEITANTLIRSGQVKLVSIHGANSHASAVSTLTLYDNTAGSGKIVATMKVVAGTSLEFDMHNVICRNGLFATVSGGTPSFTVEFA